ncbi:MAG: GFA family protein [Pseudomonadota bacterium]
MTQYHATCHCGAVELTFDLDDALPEPHRCDCSFCRRRAAATIGVPLQALRVTRGADNLGLYTWNTGTAQHHFCKTCGIYTHHRRRSNPNEYGVNFGCIEGQNPFDHEPIPWHDGINHPSDA